MESLPLSYLTFDMTTYRESLEANSIHVKYELMEENSLKRERSLFNKASSHSPNDFTIMISGC